MEDRWWVTVVEKRGKKGWILKKLEKMASLKNKGKGQSQNLN